MRQRTGPCTVTKCKGKAMKREGSKGWQIAHNKHSLTVFHMILVITVAKWDLITSPAMGPVD